MATTEPASLGDRMIQPITNISDLIWGGTWEGEAIIPFPPLALILLGVGLWVMVGLRFYPITKFFSALKGLFSSRKGSGAGEISPFAALSKCTSCSSRHGYQPLDSLPLITISRKTLSSSTTLVIFAGTTLFFFRTPTCSPTLKKRKFFVFS